MSDVIMIDTSVFGALNRANSGPVIARDLRELLNQGETLMVGASAYQEILNTPDATLRATQLRQISDFRMSIQQSSMAERAALYNDYAHVTVDKAGNTFRLQQAGVELKDLPIVADVRVQMARAGNQRVKFFTLDRMVRNREVITKNYGIEFSNRSRVMTNMGQRVPYNPEALGVTAAAKNAAPPKSVAIAEEVPPRPAPKSVPTPTTGPVRPRLTAFKAGLRAAVSAENIASLIPDAILAIADKFAVRDALRNIQTKFIKEGFAKGVAAGVMRWSKQDVALNLKNRVTPYRVQGLGDAKGTLKQGHILRLAEASENYAVDLGWEYTFSQTVGWNNDLQREGLATLAKYGYHFGYDAEALFEYDFINKLASVLQRKTDAIIGPAIKFK